MGMLVSLVSSGLEIHEMLGAAYHIVAIVNFMRSLHIILYNGCIDLHSPQWYERLSGLFHMDPYPTHEGRACLA